MPVEGGRLVGMVRKASVVIEKDENGFYAWCPELKGCQSEATTLEEAIVNIKEAIQLYLETLPVAYCGDLMRTSRSRNCQSGSS